MGAMREVENLLRTTVCAADSAVVMVWIGVAGAAGAATTSRVMAKALLGSTIGTRTKHTVVRNAKLGNDHGARTCRESTPPRRAFGTTFSS